MDARLAHTWGYVICNLKRYITIGGMAHPTPALNARSVPQGDPISMAGAALLLAHWQSHIPEPIHVYTYVDDRLLFHNSDDGHQLQQAFRQTESWDLEHGFFTRVKTVKLLNPRKNVTLKWNDDIPVCEASHIDYLGIPLALGCFSAQTWFQEKVTKICRIYELLQRAHAEPSVVKMVHQTAILPILNYSAMIARPGVCQLQHMKTAFRGALSQNKLGTFMARMIWQFDPIAGDHKLAAIARSFLTWNRKGFHIPGVHQTVKAIWQQPPLKSAQFNNFEKTWNSSTWTLIRTLWL